MLIFTKQCPHCSKELTRSLIPRGYSCSQCCIVYRVVSGGALYEIGRAYPSDLSEADMAEKMPKLKDDAGKLFKYLGQLKKNQPEFDWVTEELEP